MVRFLFEDFFWSLLMGWLLLVWWHFLILLQFVLCLFLFKVENGKSNQLAHLYFITRNLIICNQSLCNWHATSCHLQLSWSCLQLQIWYCIIFGQYGCVWTNMQRNVYNMNTCHKNNGLNLYILKLLYSIYVHRLYIIILCT